MGLLFTLVVTIFMILGHHWVTAPCKKKLARYLEIFGVQSQEALTQALGLVTDGRVPLDQEGNQQWPKVGDSADFLLTPVSSTAEFVARKGHVSCSFFKGQPIYNA